MCCEAAWLPGSRGFCVVVFRLLWRLVFGRMGACWVRTVPLPATFTGELAGFLSRALPTLFATGFGAAPDRAVGRGW
jgi:hypothetical protein